MNTHYFTRPVIPLLSAMIPGVVIGLEFPFFKKTAYCCVLICLTRILFKIIRSKTAVTAPLALFFLFGYLSILPYTEHHMKPGHVAYLADTGPLEITGTVHTTPVPSPHRVRFLLQVSHIIKNTVKKEVHGLVRVSVYGGNNITKGDRIRFKGKIRPLRNFSNPGSFDYRQYMTFQNVGGSTYVKSCNITFVKPIEGHAITGRLAKIPEEIEKSISRLIQTSCRSSEAQGLLKALITGDRQEVSPHTREIFNRTGTGHLLAISGLHIGIVGSAVFFLLIHLLSFSKAVLWSGNARPAAAFLSIFPVAFYGMIAGMSPSTQRAVIVASLILTTYGIKAEQDTMNTLAIAALLIILLFPPTFFFISFQLSFAAVFSIVYGFSKTGNPATTLKSGTASITGKFLAFLLTSIFAITGTFPLTLHYFNQFSIIGVFSNLIMIPLIGFIAVPTALAGTFISPVCYPAAKILTAASGLVIEGALILNTLLSRLPFAAVRSVTPNWLEIACFYLIFFSLLNLLPSGEKEMVGSSPETHRKIARYALAAALFIFAADALFWLKTRCFHHDFRVTVIDVGQGSANLLEFPGGECMLIDGGGFSDNAVFDVGERIVAPFLWRKKIRSVDTVVLTHPESDHLNGLLFVINHFNVKKIISTGQQAETVAYSNFLNIIEKKNIHHSFTDQINHITETNGVKISILHPPKDPAKRDGKGNIRDSNNNSIVTKAEYGKISFLFPGDIMKASEKALVRTEEDRLKSTVLIAPHHGSKTSSTLPFLSKVAPEVVVISAGWKNRYHMPHKKILERYKSAGYAIYRTDTNGAVLIKTDGDSISVHPGTRK